MEMSEDDLVAFGHFIERPYTGRFVCKRCPDGGAWDQNTKRPVGANAEHEMDWCKLWVLANGLGLDGLMK
jgi:hypothetical protein